jgi:hypothetical protein
VYDPNKACFLLEKVLRRESMKNSGVRWAQRGIAAPLSEGIVQFVIEDFRSRLEQKMRTTERPLHLLLLYEPPADHLIDGGFYESRADGFALASSLTEVGNELAVVADIRLGFRGCP